MTEVVMPRLSDTMEEGTILRWLIADGASVRRGQELAEIETDKATMTYESDLDGVFTIVAGEGDTLPVGTLIARVGAGDEVSAADMVQAPETPTGRGAANDRPSTPAGEPGAPAATAPAESLHEAAPDSVTETPPTGLNIVGSDEGPAFGGGSTVGEPSDGERVRASPVARRIARDADVDLHTLTGTGPGGRIVKADVQVAATLTPAAGELVPYTGESTPPTRGLAPRTGAAQPPGAEPAGVTTAKGETTELDLSRTQQTIARRMAESKATIPHFSLQLDIDMHECVALRSQLKSLGHTDAPTYNDMVIKACALALREHPRANSSYRDGRLQLHARVNIGVAVAVESDGPTGDALIVPTVFDADVKSLGEIARETRTLAARVREHSITPPELGGGTFTVSNLGMFGVTSFTAIINPPQAAILSVGSVEARAVVRPDGEIAARQTMTVTLACDHRILYGADAARFLARIRELLEQPASLTL
jgi:pyruvate dehydrogenase E2 component (dihydrolipoamide acetyltransferase)